MSRPTIYHLSELYLLLPDESQFRANNFANGKSPKTIGKMLTRLEEAGFLASRQAGDAKIYWKIPVIPDLLNMHLRRCIEAVDKRRPLRPQSVQQVQKDFLRKS